MGCLVNQWREGLLMSLKRLNRAPSLPSILKYGCLSLIFLLTSFSAKTQSADTLDSDEKKSKRFSVIGLPLFFFTPETKFGGGAAGLTTFKFKNDSLYSRPSSVQFGFAYTQLRQTLIYLPYQLWLKNESWNLFGELGFYKYNFFFWGIGNQQDDSLQETYYTTFPRLRINLLKRIAPSTYAGLKYGFDGFNITQIDSAGLLSNGNIVGTNGGNVSSIGTVVKYDNRDNQFYPTKGYFAELSFQFDHPSIGSDFKNQKWSLDVATYLTTKFNHTIAFNLYGAMAFGSVPFNQLPSLGGTKKMRGFYEGRYRDNHALMLQMEYRAPLFWRIGAVAFATAGDVANELIQFRVNQFKLAYGGGLRVLLDKKQKVNLRFDVARAEGNTNLYLTLTEAF